jgi:hypothetical protein
MHDRTKPPATYRLHAAPLRYQVDATKPRFPFRSSYAVRKRRQRDRDALELKQFTIELHEHRLERALTADVMR